MCSPPPPAMEALLALNASALLASASADDLARVRDKIKELQAAVQAR